MAEKKDAARAGWKVVVKASELVERLVADTVDAMDGVLVFVTVAKMVV